MNTSWTPLRTAIALAVCSASLAIAPAHGAGQAATPPASISMVKVLPGDDFFSYANAEWLATTEIPADRSSWSSFSVMAETSDARIVKLIEAAAASKTATGEPRKVADYFSAFMDEAGIEARGVAPLKPVLAKIAAIKDKSGLARALGGTLRADVDPLNSTNFFTENLFGLWVTSGLTDPGRNTPYLLQGGLGMPDRAYYLTDSARMAGLRAKYQQHIAAMLKLAGFDDTEARAARVMALETKIAQSHASREDSADVLKANNTWSAKDFAAKAPGMDWQAFFKAARLDGAERFIVWHPGAVSGAAALVAGTELATWKDFLAFHQINHFSAVLPKAFGDQRFEFSGKAMSGTPQQSLRWKRALAATNGAMDDAVGKMYVERYFPAGDKVRVQKMVANIIAAFSRRIDALDWMAPATRAQAQQKLKTMYVGVGYPDRWTSYAGLQVKRGDAFGNAMRAEQYHYAQQVGKLKQKVDKTAWAMPPQLVNAVNLPLQNAMNFPAAVLQPPFYDPAAADGANYGAIGAIIGHEISHSFDDQGAQFDAQGRLRDWWTKEDMAYFKQAADKLVKQFNAYQPFPDLAVNGQLTLSENLADLAGVSASYDAYKASLGSQAPADADQQFFPGFAHAWRSKTREPAARQRLLTDGHAPGEYRSAIVRNLAPWYKTFDVQPEQKLYLAPSERVRVW